MDSSQKRRRIIAVIVSIALIVAAVLILGVFFAASRPEKSLPVIENGNNSVATKSPAQADNSSFSQNFPVVKEKSQPEKTRIAADTQNATTAEAERADKEFHASKLCFDASITLELARNVMNICAAKSGDPQAYGSCLQTNGGDAAKIQGAQSRVESCTDRTGSIDESYYASVVNAARLGSSDAQICYVQSAFNHNFTDDEIKLYKHFAGIYSNEAFKRGDWRIAQLMSTDAGTLSHGVGLLQYLTNGHPVTVYRMNRLMRLGAVGKYASFLDNTLDISKLTPQQTAEAEAWALQEYNNYFFNSPALESAPVPCLDVK